MLIGNKVPFDIPLALAEAAPLQPISISQQQIQQATDFVIRRLEQVLVDGGTSVEAVRAVLRHRGNSPALAAASAQELQVCGDQATAAFLCLLSVVRLLTFAHSRTLSTCEQALMSYTTLRRPGFLFSFLPVTKEIWSDAVLFGTG